MIQTLNPGSSRLEGTGNDAVVDFHLNIQWRILIDSPRRLENGKNGNGNTQKNGAHEAVHSRKTRIRSLGVGTVVAFCAIGSRRPVTAIV